MVLLAEIWDEAVRYKSRGELLFRRLFDLAKDKNKSIALRAIGEILDRRLGKPTQAMEINQDGVEIKVQYVDPQGELIGKSTTMVEGKGYDLNDEIVKNEI